MVRAGAREIIYDIALSDQTDVIAETRIIKRYALRSFHNDKAFSGLVIQPSALAPVLSLDDRPIVMTDIDS